MKKSFVKLVATSAVALTLVGSASALAAPKNVLNGAPVFSTKESAQYWIDNNKAANEVLAVVEEDGQFYVVDNTPATTVAPTTEEKSKESTTTTTIAPTKAEDPFGTEAKLDKGAQKNAFENVGRHFKTLAEAVEAYPNAFVMYEPSTNDYVVYTDVQGQKTFVFNSSEDAVNAFPNKKAMYENGKYYVFTDQAPRLQYEFKTLAEAVDAFGEDANPMFKDGKYIVYTNKLPKLTHVFDSYEDAMKAFPGSFPMYENGKYYVFTTYEKIAGTKGSVVENVEGKLQDTNQKLEKQGQKEVATETESTNKPADKPAAKPAKKDEKKAELPQTGEASTFAIAGAAVLSALAGLGFVAKKEN